MQSVRFSEQLRLVTQSYGIPIAPPLSAVLFVKVTFSQSTDAPFLRTAPLSESAIAPPMGALLPVKVQSFTVHFAPDAPSA